MSPSRSAVIAHEDFNSYSPGDLAGNNGGTGWTGTWNSFTAANDVISGGLSYAAGSVTVNGGANTMQKSGGAGGVSGSLDPYFNRSFTATSSPQVWMSFLLQAETTVTGNDFLQFYLGSVTTAGNSGAVLIDPANGGLGVRLTAATTQSAFSGQFTAGTTCFVVVRLSGDGPASATNYDRLELWVNPTSSTLGTPAATVNLDTGINSLACFGVRVARIEAGDIFKFDELTIGTTQADVISPSGGGPVLQAWVASPMENIFRDTTMPSGAPTSISALAARNEYESAQVCLRNPAAFTINSVSFTSLTKGTDQIPASALKYNFVEFVHYNTNSSLLTHKVRNAPADYPDALSNAVSMAVASNTTQPVWITAKVAKGQPPGIYLGSATVNTTAGAVNVPISLEVVEAEIPDASAGYPNAPMFDLTYGDNDAIVTQYGHAKYSTGWWNIVGKLCDNAIANRTNVAYIVPLQLLIDGGSTKNGSTYTFNWSRFDELVEFFLARGFRSVWAEGVCYRDGEGGPIYVSTFGNDEDPVVGAPEATAYLNQFLAALKSHLQTKGWLDKFVMQILDEPRPTEHDEWNAVAALVPPEVKLIESFFPPATVTSHQGVIDAWVPSIVLYEQQKTYFDNRQAAGDQKWYYTYGEMGGRWLNRLIDTPVYKNRLLFWYAYRFGHDGYLQWGYNWWGDNSQDLTSHGDAWIIYPDAANATVKSSIREANQRDGVEELELFRQLATVNPTLAQQIASSIITSGTDYSNSISQIAASREQLLRATPAPAPAIILHQAESLSFTASDSVTEFTDSAASGGKADRLDANAMGDFLTYAVPISQAGTYTVKVRYKTYSARGQFQLSVDGVNVGGVVDQYSAAQTWIEVNLGHVTIPTAGNRSFTFSVAGQNAASTGHTITFDYLKLERN